MNAFKLYGKLLNQQWKESVRNPMFQKKLLVNLVMGFFFLYLLASLLFLSFMAKFMFEEIFDMSAARALNGLLLYTIAGTLLLRFLMQRLPLMDIGRYLHLPIQKGSLVHFLFMKTLLGVFNLFPLALILPFFLHAVLPEYSWAASFSWLILFLSLVAFNNLLAFYFKKEFARNPWFIAAFGVLLVGAFLLNYYGLLDIMSHSRAFFDRFLSTPWLSIGPVLLVIIVYGLLHRWTRRFLVLDAGVEQGGEKVKEASDLGLRRFGTVGRLAAFEIDMIRRNKKPRTFALVAFFFLLYGLVFYPNPGFEGNHAMMIFVGVITTGIFMMNFGQLHFAWDSPHFDKILTTRLRVRDYILSKYLVMLASAVVMFVLSLPYAYFGSEVIFINFCALLFNAGFGSMVLLFLAMYNRKGMSLSKSSMFNYEGVQMSQFLLVPFILGLPFFIYGGFALFGRSMMGVGAVGAVGFLCLLVHPFLFPVLERMFHARKHLIAEGFRSS